MPSEPATDGNGGLGASGKLPVALRRSTGFSPAARTRAPTARSRAAGSSNSPTSGVASYSRRIAARMPAPYFPPGRGVHWKAGAGRRTDPGRRDFRDEGGGPEPCDGPAPGPLRAAEGGEGGRRRRAGRAAARTQAPPRVRARLPRGGARGAGGGGGVRGG